MTGNSAVLPYYLKELRGLLGRKATAVAFVLTSAMHALGHALMALVASALALSLASRWGMQSGGMGAGWPAKLLRGGSAADAAFLFSFVGLAVVMPVLGHSTWHLYRKLVEPGPPPDPEPPEPLRQRRYAAQFPAALFAGEDRKPQP